MRDRNLIESENCYIIKVIFGDPKLELLKVGAIEVRSGDRR
ncbi:MULTISPECIES: hypothetical protein [unclassified Tychonema]|nr:MULTISPECIES: hypothetical protein [unclassified Tychonema]